MGGVDDPRWRDVFPSLDAFIRERGGGSYLYGLERTTPDVYRVTLDCRGLRATEYGATGEQAARKAVQAWRVAEASQPTPEADRIAALEARVASLEARLAITQEEG